MPVAPDPFRHHPALADLVRDPAQSFFRDLDLDAMDARMAERGIPMPWRRPDAEREATRHAFLAGHEGPLWVFGYGSLMWDPAILFDEIRHAKVGGYHRSMCLVDRRGARGSNDAPGLMAGLAAGGTCDGLAFRIPAPLVAAETERLWRREMIAYAYVPVMATASTAQGDIPALCFVADPLADTIDTGLCRDRQVEYIATGEGFLGTSREYLENMLAHFDALGITDPDLRDLLRDVQAHVPGGAGA